MSRMPAKQAYRAVFLSLQADAKSYPGGISGLAKAIGLNDKTLANCLNPDHEGQPPSLSTTLEIINLAQARRGVFAIAQIVDQVPMDIEPEARATEDAVKQFMHLSSDIGEFLTTGGNAASDLRFDADERGKIEVKLDHLIHECVVLKRALRGGA